MSVGAGSSIKEGQAVTYSGGAGTVAGQSVWVRVEPISLTVPEGVPHIQLVPNNGNPPLYLVAMQDEMVTEVARLKRQLDHVTQE